jgi:hypothetical protein
MGHTGRKIWHQYHANTPLQNTFLYDTRRNTYLGIQNISNLNLGSNLQISTVASQSHQTHGLLAQFFENPAGSDRNIGSHQMRQGIYRFQTRPDHHLTEFGMLVSLFQPRSFVGQILVDITESLNCHIGTSLQFKIVHLCNILSADDIHVNGGIQRRRDIWNDTSTKLLTQIGGTMHQIAQGITQIAATQSQDGKN